MQVTAGEHIIDQGDDGDNFYVIDRYAFPPVLTTDRFLNTGPLFFPNS
jgi:hypothetical protein